MKNKENPGWPRALLWPGAYRCAKSQSLQKELKSPFPIPRLSVLRDASPWSPERKARNCGAGNPPHCGAHNGPAVRGNRVNSHENSDKWAPPPLPLPQLKPRLSQPRCRNHFQARHDINISVIRGGQWGVRLIEKQQWIRPGS